MSASVNVYDNVREYDTDLDVFGVAFEWVVTAVAVALCVERVSVLQHGIDALSVAVSGDVASSVLAPGSDASQVGCCR